MSACLVLHSLVVCGQSIAVTKVSNVKDQRRFHLIALLLVAFALTPGMGYTQVKPQSGQSHKIVGGSKIVKPTADRGLLLMKAHQCFACHHLHDLGAQDGVALDKLHRSREFIVQHVLDPEENVARYPAAFNNEPNLMPAHQLSRSEAKAIADYLLGRKSGAKAGKSKNLRSSSKKP